MTALHIADDETERLVRQLAEGLSAQQGQTVRLTEAVNRAVRNELARCDIEVSQDKALGVRAELDKEMRSTTRDYARLLARARGTKGVGSRVYQMLARHGSVETLRRLVSGPTEGLRFLQQKDRLDLAAETIALKPKYKNIIPEDIRSQAQSNLGQLGHGS